MNIDRGFWKIQIIDMLIVLSCVFGGALIDIGICMIAR